MLSGMNDMEQMRDNLQDVSPLTDAEMEAIRKAVDIINSRTAIPCTGCRYCESGCPNKIAIPDYFAMYNEVCRYPDEDWKIQPGYDQLTLSRGKASDCIGCGACERNCPQGLKIATYLADVTKIFEQG